MDCDRPLGGDHWGIPNKTKKNDTSRSTRNPKMKRCTNTERKKKTGDGGGGMGNDLNHHHGIKREVGGCELSYEITVNTEHDGSCQAEVKG